MLCAVEGIAQQASDSIYAKLDLYLATPSAEQLTDLQHELQKRGGSREARLAAVVAYCNIGYKQHQKGRLRAAIYAYEKAKSIFFANALKRYDIIEYCLKPLGNLYLKTQALTAAENTIKSYIFLAREQNRPKQELGGVINLSVLYYSRGEFSEAIQLVKEALKKRPRQVELKVNLASSYFAAGQIEDSMRLLDELEKSSAMNAKAYQLKAEIYRYQKAYPEALKNLKKATQLLKKNTAETPRELAKLALAAAEVYAMANQSQRAMRQLEHVYKLLIPFYETEAVLPNKLALYPETILMDALDLQAKLWKLKGDVQRALKAYNRANAVNQELFLQLYAQQSRLLMQQHLNKRSEKMLALLYTLSRKSNTGKWAKEALRIDAWAKARVVVEAAQFKRLLESKDTTLFQRLQDLQRKTAIYRLRIFERTQRGDFKLYELEKLQLAYDNSLTQQRLLYKQIQTALFDFEETPDLSLSRLQQKAAHLNVTIVSYAMGAHNLYQFIVDGNEIQFNRLTNSCADYSKLHKRIQAYNALFDKPLTINKSVAHYTTLAAQLYQQLNLPKTDKLVLIPDGILAFVPFQSLLTQHTSTRNYEQMQFLIRQTKISYALSLTSFMHPSTAFTSEQHVIGFFPVFKDSPNELYFSEAEAKAIEAVFPTEILRNAAASRAAFMNRVDEGSIIHISTHALGGDFYAPAEVLFYDARLNVKTLYGMHFSPQLVVLSACETGVGKVMQGEGALSLARGFRYAGAHNILFSLWEVNDKSTAEWMRYYYQNLAELQSRNEAVQLASLAYLENESIPNARKSPYYWSAFVYYGAVDLPQSSSPHNDWWWRMGLFLGVLALMVWGMKLKKEAAHK